MKESVLANLLRDIHSDNKKLRPLRNIGIELTERCNLGCKHCYMNASSNNKNDLLSTADIKKFVTNIKIIFGTKISISITGGEPLVRKDVFQILRFIKEQGFIIGFSTNGLLLNKETIHELEKYISAISISLDGVKVGHNKLRNTGIFDQTTEAIVQLSTSKITDVCVKTVVYKHNLNELTDVWNLINKFNIQSWHLIPFEPMGRGENNQNLLLTIHQYNKLCKFVDKLRKENRTRIKILFEEQPEDFNVIKTADWALFKRCSAGIYMFSILHDGSIVSCVNCNRKTMTIHGNIKKDDIETIWRDSFGVERGVNYKYCNSHYYLNELQKGNNEH